jgi:hypothetical protein
MKTDIFDGLMGKKSGKSTRGSIRFDSRVPGTLMSCPYRFRRDTEQELESLTKGFYLKPKLLVS